MKRNKIYIISFLMLILLIGNSFTLFGRKNSSINNQNTKIFDLRWVQANQMNMPLTNYSQFGQTVSGDAGFYWPSGFSNETYIYGAGLWVGGLVRNAVDPTRFDTQVTCGYDPSGGAVEFTAGLIPNDDVLTNPTEKVYFSTDAIWPLKDFSGVDSILSALDTYGTYNDYDTSRHMTTDNKPLKISVLQQTYSWTGSLKEDIIFFVYNVVLDPSVDTLHNAFLSVVADNDIGNEAAPAANDLCGFDIGRNMGFQWQDDPESGWAHIPGTIAFKFLQGPKSNGVDTVHYFTNSMTGQPDSIVIQPDDTLGMTAFKVFAMIGNAGDPDDKYERYQVMSGYNYQTLNPNNVEESFNPYDKDDFGPHDKRFVESSGPFNLVPGDTAKIIFAILMASDTTELPVKADVAQAIFDGGWLSPGPPNAPKLYGTPDNKKVSLYWENNAELSPDKYAKLAVIDSIWQYISPTDSVKKANPSYNPKYRAYDFAGYKVWKSTYDIKDSFKLVAHYDKVDGYKILNQDSLFDVFGDSFVITKAETLGNDNGLAYSYIDEDLLYNGVHYYYAVTAYDANFENYMIDALTGDTIGIQPTSYSSAITGNKTNIIPQVNATNYSGPKASMVYITGNPQLDSMDIIFMKAIAIVDSLIDTTKLYQIHFGPIGKTSDGIKPTYSFVLYNSTDSLYMPADTAGNPAWIDIQTDTVPYADNGPVWKTSCRASIPISGAVIDVDSIIVKPANNVVDSITLNDLGTPYNTDNLYLVDSVYITYPKIKSHPCYNGGSYKITWHPVYIDSLSDSALTCDVYDIVNETEIPYSGLWETSWRFGKVSSETDQGQYALVSSSTANNWKWMYIAGTMILFNYHPEMPIPPQRIQPMEQANKPVEGEEWYIYTTGCPTPSSGNIYNISFTKGVFDTIVTDSLLKLVSVVPNPYLVRNIMEPSENESKIMFTNLPDSCNIFIYTLSGDLVDLLEHRDISGNGMEYWNVLTNPNLAPASGIYLYVVETIDQEHRATGKFAIIK
jgi:hypothetical protein